MRTSGGTGRRRGALTAVVAAALLALAGAGPASASNLYLAIGDSVGAGFGASAGNSYFDLYCAYLESAASVAPVDQCVNESVSGATTGSALAPGDQVDEAVSAIESSTTTPVVTIILGGNDLLGSPGCEPITGSGCQFTANAGTILDRLDAALATRPGTHLVQWLEYYNPNHDNPFGSPSEDANSAQLLLGSDLTIGDCATETTDEIGLNDAINCVALAKEAVPVDAYDPFQSACATETCFSDALHPNDTGYGLIFDAFRDAATSSLTPPPAPPPPPSPPAPIGSTPPAPAGSTGPSKAVVASVSHLSESRRSFAASHGHFKGGTVFSLRLDQPATVTVIIERLASGRLVGHKCRPGTRQLAGRPRCTRTIPVTRLTGHGRAGVNKLPFDGRVHGHALAPGRYLAAVTAANAAGTSRPQGLRFRVRPPRSG